MRLTTTGKIVVLLLVIGAAVGLWKLTSGSSNIANTLMPNAKTQDAVVPARADLPQLNGAPASDGVKYVAPGTGPGCADKPEVRLLGYAWNAQMALHLAIGGAQSTNGSLMCKHGVNLKFQRQDDNGKLQEALVAFATELSQGNPNPTKGAHFVTIMGDGGPAFLKGLNDTLKRLGPEYQAKIVDAFGYSRGEDKFMGPVEWKSSPAASKGGFAAGVIRDGDWNIAQKWLGDNGLRNNPDEKTYDPDALNWANASDYIDAAQKYIAGYSEDRPVVRNGKKTGQTKHIVVNGVVTWTPGDVTVAEKKGGLVSIASTKEYTSQMPCVVIGIDKWMKANRPIVEGMVQAVAEASDQIKADPAALKRAAEISNANYHESGTDAAYWEKYFKGTQQADKTGQQVELGGSSVNNLADSLVAFGLVPGSADAVAATYKVFGDIAVQQYRSLMPNYPSAAQVIDTSYLQAVARKVGTKGEVVAKAATPKYDPKAKLTNVVSTKRWYIPFASGQASFQPAAKKDLERLARDLVVAGGTAVEVHGYTDSQGNPQANMQLSENRAFAVKNWLEKRSPVNFPQGRIRVHAHGQDNPVASNSTDAGRAKNRRVEIVLGTTATASK